MSDPMAYLHQATAHQLRTAIENIEDGDGLVKDFDYDEELLVDYSGAYPNGLVQQKERVVTLELTYILPE